MTVAVGLLPVLFFLGALIYLDSYKLVRKRFVAGALVGGCVLAVVCWGINTALGGAIPVGYEGYSRFIAPIVEESVKALLIIGFARANRIGFLVDAAIYGFAIGTGFALVENVVYWSTLTDASWSLWLVRGFGTAIMHGGCTAIVGIVGKALTERGRWPTAGAWAAAIAVAILIHSFFNSFFLAPVTQAAVIVLFLPPLAYMIFRRSERSLEQWLNVGFDADTELLELVLSGHVSGTPVGNYLGELRSRFPGEVLVDMLCYLRLHLELSLRAKGLLMMREAGFPVVLDGNDKAKLEELDFLERSIGTVGKLTMKPFLRTTSRDLWEIYMMREEAKR
ncbi:MAG TPA: PrsW family glutamic-type intramembrane protease [Candidatus Polarisedimenticolaceae bacterium]|nr:PrsW family glutamic-type intramembrane protease [Candidatus Polarisedimenticolaceae bacterium]